VSFTAELAQIKLGLIIINIIAKVKVDAAVRLREFNFTDSPVRLLYRNGRKSGWARFKGGNVIGAQGKDRVVRQISEQQRSKLSKAWFEVNLAYAALEVNVKNARNIYDDYAKQKRQSHCELEVTGRFK
jgi:hypothetical protein